MNLKNYIRGLHKLDMSVDDIVNFLCDVIVDSYLFYYTPKKSIKRKVAPFFKLIGIDNTKEYEQLLKNDAKSVIREQLRRTLDLNKCVRDVINELPTSLTKLEEIIHSPNFVGVEKFDEVFCKLYVQQNTNSFVYNEYELSELRIPQEITETVALNVLKYVVQSCFTVDDFFTNSKYLHTIGPYLEDVEYVKKALEYTHAMLEQCKNVSIESINNVAEFCCVIASGLPKEHIDDVFKDIVELRHLMSKGNQTVFIKHILENQLLSTLSSFEQYIKVISECIKDGVGLLEVFSYCLNDTMMYRITNNLMLTGFSRLDEKSVKQFLELTSILAAFEDI